MNARVNAATDERHKTRTRKQQPVERKRDGEREREKEGPAAVNFFFLLMACPQPRGKMEFQIKPIHKRTGVIHSWLQGAHCTLHTAHDKKGELAVAAPCHVPSCNT